ncbi:MAG: type II toxin-antitoxin system VapC family toxin [Prevotellaceae bacterium]|jgi:predicted nucleic acid-binding protein|nr:type II toxin-antitoxin system VapC family toxin [Prevotellaceae bacterium]
MILCDTNILIEIYRKNADIISVVSAIAQNDEIAISDVTRAEMLVGARNKNEMHVLIRELGQLKCLPIQSEISEISIQLLAQYTLSYGLDFHDALIAATAAYYDIELFTLNLKDFRFMSNIKLYQNRKNQ